MKTIFIASDHAGIELKNFLLHKFRSKDFLPNLNREILDLGPQTTDSVDYPDYADLLCKKMTGLSLVPDSNSETDLPKQLGILICGSGQGMCIRANKYSNIRAALVYNNEIAKLSREHNNANVICLGARFVTNDQALEYLNTFLITKFTGGRHTQRVVKLSSPI